MFCYQCEQTAKGTGCTLKGVCGKEPEVAALQDLLVESVLQLAKHASKLHQAGKPSREIDSLAATALFATLTNVNFDAKALEQLIRDTSAHSGFKVAATSEALIDQAAGYSLLKHISELGDTVAGLQNLVLIGLKGVSAYLHHAYVLGQYDPAAYAKFHELLLFVASRSTDVNALTGQALEVGALNLKAMELLDKANTGAYGNPVPTKVLVTPVKGKAILISGHDLKDLAELLRQTQGKGINVYTHGEMLPAHGYPELKKYAHLAGNYGGAWQEQKKDFAAFPGAILMTTNCLQKPDDSYKARIFTSGNVGWPGVTHISGHDFSPVIKAALAEKGFAESVSPEKQVLVGFAHSSLMAAAPAVINAVKAGKIRHFFLIGGCDGAKPGRNYYTEFAEKVPHDCVILTLACGKYRLNKREFGDIGGIPRLIDIGQCNDAHSAVQLAVALAGAFNCGVNDLPLSLVLSWYEQKAVAILLSLLHLGIKDIRLGPSLPAFITPPVLNVLVEKFAIKPISTPDADLAAILK